MLETTRLLDCDPLPSFVDPEEIEQRAAASLLPRTRMRVSESSELYRAVVSGGSVGMWRNADMPYMVEPMNCTAERGLEAVVFSGPARSGKSAGLLINPLVHAVVCDPRDALILHIGQADARQFSLRSLDPVISASQEVRARIGVGTHDDNILDKRFQGMWLTIGYPTIQQLSAKDYELVLITDRDRMTDSVDGEGDPFDLARKRTQTFGTRGMTVVESSPGRIILDPNWKPATPHEAPPVAGGILEHYNRGDRRWRYWQCPQCGEWFSARFRDLDWHKAKDGHAAIPIEEAAESAYLVCPHNGCIIPPSSKLAMDSHGHWLRDGQNLDRDGKIIGEGRRSSIASFQLFGPAAAFQSWQGLVRNYLQAMETCDRTDNPETLKVTVNVDQGEAFLLPKSNDKEAIDVEALKLRAEPAFKFGTVPDGVRVLAAFVDIQGRYYDVGIIGYGPGFEGYVVDKFQIAFAADGVRMVDPGAYAEDWDLLYPLLDRAWPLASDPSRGMKLLTGLVDSAGMPGVTGNAYSFAAKARAAPPNGMGISSQRLMLSKGDAHVGPKRIALTTVDHTVRGRVMASGLKVLLLGTNDLKDDVASGLRREQPGPGYLHAPKDMPGEYFDQIAAEQRDEKGKWAKGSSNARNELLDQLVGTRAALLRAPWRFDRIDWTNPPPWAQDFDRNTLVVPMDGVPPPRRTSGAATSADAASPQGSGVSSSGRRRQWRSSYMG